MLELIVTLVILGIILYGVNSLPMPGWIKTLIQVIAAVFAVVLVANAFGVNVRFPR